MKDTSIHGAMPVKEQISGEYDLKPILLEAGQAHRGGWVEYLEDGTVVFRPPLLAGRGLPAEVKIPPKRQFPGIRATFDDLNKALSRLANSPLIEGASTLRDRYEAELAHYEELVLQAYEAGKWEPDYGTYVFDHRCEELYLLAPEPWHRLALVTSNSKLAADPEHKLSWMDIRRKLESAVVGFAGLSVGGNLLEGWLREARPKQVKIADPDWIELTNFNRCERASVRHLTASRRHRFDPRNPYEVPRVPKAEYIAYEQNLVDPYLKFHIYQEPLNRANLERFLAGDGAGEPAIDVLVEEVDDLDVKIEIRQLARRHGIDVLMLTDFGHRTQVLWNPFGQNNQAPLGAGGDDAQLAAALAATRQGDRRKLFEFCDVLCRFDFSGDPFESYVKGEGEQPTGSLPQSGATTMIAGGLGGKELMWRVLGHQRAINTEGVVYDFMGKRAWRM